MKRGTWSVQLDRNRKQWTILVSILTFLWVIYTILQLYLMKCGLQLNNELADIFGAEEWAKVSLRSHPSLSSSIEIRLGILNKWTKFNMPQIFQSLARIYFHSLLHRKTWQIGVCARVSRVNMHSMWWQPFNDLAKIVNAQFESWRCGDGYVMRNIVCANAWADDI